MFRFVFSWWAVGTQLRCLNGTGRQASNVQVMIAFNVILWLKCTGHRFFRRYGVFCLYVILQMQGCMWIVETNYLKVLG